METSLMVNDYPTPPEEKTKTVSFKVYVELTFNDIELLENETIEEYLENNGICDYDEYEIEDIQ